MQAVLDMEAPEDPRSPARNGPREIAARELKARGAEEGRRSSICWMCGGSFAGGRCREIQEIALEIGKQEQ